MNYLKLLSTNFLIVFLTLPSLSQNATTSDFNKKPDFGLVDSLQQIGMLERAEQLILSMREECEAEENWNGFIETSLRLTMIYKQGNNYPGFEEAAKFCISTIEARASNYSNECLPIYQDLQRYYYDNFRFDESLQLLEKQLILLKSKPRLESNFKLAVLYMQFGVHYLNVNNLSLATEYNHQALTTLADLEDSIKIKKLKSQIYKNMGWIDFGNGNLSKGIDKMIKATTIASEVYGEFNDKMISYYFSLASTYQELKESEQAVVYYQKVIYTLNKNSDRFNPLNVQEMTLSSNSEIALNWINAGKYKQAEKLLLKNIANFEQSPHPNFSPVIDYNRLGEIKIRENDFSSAIKYIKMAEEKLKIYPQYGNNDSLVLLANTFVTYANLYKKQENFPQSIEYKKREGEIGKRSPFFPFFTFYTEMSELYFLNQDLDSALHYNNLALSVLSPNFLKNKTTHLPLVSDFSDYTESYKALGTRIGIFLKLAQQKTDETKVKELVLQGLQIAFLADTMHSQNLKKINLRRANQSKTLINQSSLTFTKSIKTAASVYHLTNNSSYLEQAFYFCERMKSQQLTLTQLSSEAKLYSDISGETLEAERQFVSEINAIERQILLANQRKDTSNIQKLKNEVLISLKEDYNSLLKKMEQNNENYYKMKYNFKNATPQSLQNMLSKDEVLIEYVLEDKELFVFIFSKNNNPHFSTISLNEKIDKQIQAYQTLLKNSTMSRPSSREKFITLSHQLYQQFLQPIENQLQGKKRLIIIGDGMTNYIPFETLLASQEVKPFTELDFLVKKYEISYHYSATLFAKAKRKARTQNEGIFAFAPVYDNNNSTSTTALRNYDFSAIDSTLRAYRPDGSFSPLPESENEVKSIAQLFEQQKSNAKLALRAEATEANLKTNLEAPYRFAHIAGHSFADLNNPKFSGIACYQEEKIDSTSTNDGTLFTGEIYNISSQADLVTLSSCESGFGKLEKTEGLLGLNRAFIYAGTPNVVFSLWKVYDKVSAKLMVDFYENVLSNEDYASSLRAAKLSLLENEATASPHFWSPFLLIGR